MVRAHKAGLCVIPVGANKVPALKWTPYQSQRPTDDEIVQFAQMDVDGIGFACGPVSGNLEMLELEGVAVEAGIAKKFGEHELVKRIAAGCLISSPRGGAHLLYKCTEPTGEGNKKLASRITADGEIQTLIETRGEGGYVVAAPSGGRTNPNGGKWAIVHGGWDTMAEITLEERASLFALARSYDEVPRAGGAEIVPADGLRERGAGAAGDRPGDTFNREHTWAEVLEPHGYKLLYISKGESYWQRPGKDEGTSATTGYHLGNDTLKVFSTSTPFSTDKTYDRFGAWAVLNGHGDDLSAAARALRPDRAPMPLSHILGAPGGAEGAVGVEYERPWRTALREPQPFLVRGWIEGATVSAIFGDSDVGKSWTTLGLACAVATGTRWLGNEVREPRTVVYFAAESRAHASRRIAGIAEHLGLDEGLLDANLFLIDPPAESPWPIPVSELRASVERRGAALLVIDTLSATSWVDDEQDNAQAARMVAWLTGIADDLGTHVMVVHHSGKDASKGQRGASALRANVRAEFNVVRDDEGDLLLASTKMNNAPAPMPIDIILEVFELKNPPTAWGVSSTSAAMVVDRDRGNDARQEITDIVGIVVELGGLRVPRGRIVTAAKAQFGVSGATVDRRLMRAITLRRLVKDSGGYSSVEKSRDWLIELTGETPQFIED